MTTEKEYIILKIAKEISIQRNISIAQAFYLPSEEFWNAGVTV